MLDLDALARAVVAHSRVVRVVMAEVKGSAPREAGTAMLVWDSGSEGTIGGGRLELEAERTARAMLEGGPPVRLIRESLGPALNQCCGGAVTLGFELYDPNHLQAARGQMTYDGVHVRRVGPGPEAMPDKLKRRIANASDSGNPMPITLHDGWLAEPVWQPRQPVYIYGAGHVGRALALALAPMPQFDVMLADVREDCFENLPDNVRQSWQLLPTDIMAAAPDDAAHFIMTPEHDYDLELCHRLLARSFGYAGLIGSKTKWARFRSRLSDLGHSDQQIDRICCPIGDPGLGKHPQAIAVGVVAALLVTSAAKPKDQRKSA